LKGEFTLRTTININPLLLTRLKEASGTLEISTNEIIMLLLGAVQSKKGFNIGELRGVRYQDADPDRKWCRFHVTYRSRMYEKALDMRRFFKCSVSFIISFAIFKYLDEIVERIKDSENSNRIMDNYPSNYIFISKMYNGIQGFTIIWGVPEQKYLENLIQ
jgi:hypothetical protein